MSEKALALAEEHGGVWEEHPGYPVSDWRYEVSNDDTRSSYWDWVLHKTEED